jgi:protein-tyrosine phosphatase/nicotinamidase-related amidase
MTSLLITQCLQNDFVKPLNKHEILPNKLHIGYREAERLMGEIPSEGPIARLMKWAYEQDKDQLEIIHIRDWHDHNNPQEKNHFNQFGHHCIKNTEGAEFVFKEQMAHHEDHIVNASGLNDFVDTDLKPLLDKYINEEIKVGIIGVWTDAKISFLTYELATRYPNFKISICSALTASSSTSMHFVSIDRLKNLFGIGVFSSIGDFTTFLTGSIPDIHQYSKTYGTQLSFQGENNILPNDKKLIHFLFRNSQTATFKVLDGGFSGNVVLKSYSTDIYGHKQASSVLKIGPRRLISNERDAFEQIKDVLGNNAPNIIDFAEDEERGAIKYRYAAMYGEVTSTFQDLYTKAYDEKEIHAHLHTIFKEQLGKLYDAKNLEKLDLLAYYEFSSDYADGVKHNMEQVIGTVGNQESISIEGLTCYNVLNFYRHEIDQLKNAYEEQHFMSFVHGDLNGANVIIDGQSNVWLIDFFHTHYGHILKDLIKLENDLLFIYTPIHSAEEFADACHLIDTILEVGDLASPPKSISLKFEANQNALRTVRQLRSYYPELIEFIRDPYQYHVAMLRYSMHTLSFDESNLWQKKLALYTGTLCAQKIVNKHKQSKILRLDFLNSASDYKGKNHIAMTLLPGRKDMNRNLAEDIKVIQAANISNVLTLVTNEELHKYGVPNLIQEFEKAGLKSLQIQIKDQGIPTTEEIERICNWLDAKVNKNEKTLIHCLGGLGRTGTLAALYLKTKNQLSAEEAIAIVRESRSPRAIESKEQIKLIED